MRESSTESAVAKLLSDLGLSFRRWDTSLPGRPDFVLDDLRIVVFAHGCYWHRHSRCAAGRRLPLARRQYWLRQFSKRVSLDQQQSRVLRDEGWWVFVAWECELRHSSALIQDDVAHWVEARIGSMKPHFPPMRDR